MMYSFDGEFRQRPEQSLGGASKKLPREELLRKAALERQEREITRKKISAAIKIQAFVRGCLSRKHNKINERNQFDNTLQYYNVITSSSEKIKIIGKLLQKFIYFYTEECDSQRLACISQITLQNSSLIASMLLNDSVHWKTRIQKLLMLNLRYLVGQVSNPIPLAVPLRLIEVFTSVNTYNFSKETRTIQDLLRNLWTFLIKRGYFKHLLVILENRVPDSISNSPNPPTPIASSLLDLFMGPLLIESSSLYRIQVLQYMLQEVFQGPLLLQVINFLLPSLASRSDIIKASEILDALLPVEDSNRYKCLTISPSPWLLYAVLALISPQTEILSRDTVIHYLHVLRHLVTVIPAFSEDVDVLNEADERDEDMKDEDQDEELERISEVSIEMLNNQQHVNILLSAVETEEGNSQTLISLCCICHTLLLHHKLAIHRYRLLYSLTFKPKFLRYLWYSVVSSTTSVVFDSQTSLLQLLARGVPLSSSDLENFLPQLTLFCAFLGHLLPTLYDIEFYGDETGLANPSTMPFSTSELATISLTLRDVCLGLIELAYPDVRPSFNKEYQRAMLSIGAPPEKISSEEMQEVKKWLQLFKVTVTLLRQLYSRDARRQYCEETHWLAPQVEIPINRPRDLQFGCRRIHSYRPFIGMRSLTREQMGKNNDKEGCPLTANEIRHMTILKELPFVVSFHDRVKIFQSLIANDRRENQGEMVNFMIGLINLQVRRNYIYEDAFDKLSIDNEPNLKLKMRVQLVNAVGLDEAGIDGGGIFREFLSELLKTAFDPNRGFFKTTHDRLLYPNPSVHLLVDNFTKHYFFIGRILGKAIYENMLVELPFAGFFLSKILARYSSDVDIHHLASLDPVMYKNLLYLKTYTGDVSDIGLDFTVLNSELGENQMVDLKSNGSSIPVTNSNRIEYIHLMADYKLNKQIRVQCAAFKEGLANVINLEWLRMFDPNELQILISGAHTPVDVEDLKIHTNYAGGYSIDHPIIKAFWRVVENFDEKRKRQLLKFVTSCSRPPLLGFKDLSPAFCIQYAGNEPDRLPTASTCMNLLKLPEFKDEETLRAKLLYAIESGSGFELS
ncbi:ubiquitin-protein ligase E3C-like [Centruroides sculpturatus]|uniref:ubiquitin-protein ligase E3C-like n=1 Tax=Centruroides sculpturatus TaxID=218467 RepID=UPI000C6CD738|nr:ubiquitin-protein ligase E3C-like [Centruroides sculpturatus]